MLQILSFIILLSSFSAQASVSCLRLVHPQKLIDSKVENFLLKEGLSPIFLKEFKDALPKLETQFLHESVNDLMVLVPIIERSFNFEVLLEAVGENNGGLTSALSLISKIAQRRLIHGKHQIGSVLTLSFALKDLTEKKKFNLIENKVLNEDDFYELRNLMGPNMMSYF